jgi:F0F1-type ATP synthase gamma subunit
MPFQKGESGNPAGRPRGARNRATLLMESLLADDAEAIVRKAVEMAKAGEIAALRMCLDRLVPARKDEPVVFDLPPLDTAADSVAAAARIVAGVADGDLTPSEAMDLAKVIDVYVGALATKAFEERLAKLESAANR